MGGVSLPIEGGWNQSQQAAWPSLADIWCIFHCCILQTSFAGATLLTVVDQFALNVLGDNDIISTDTIGECHSICALGFPHC